MTPEASRGKHIPVSVYTPQIPYRNARGWIGASGERRRRLTSWNIDGPQFCSGAGIFPSLLFLNTSPLHHSPCRPKFVVFGAAAPPPQWARDSSFMRFVDHTQRCTTVSKNLLDEWSARRRKLYLTTHNTHNRETSMQRVGSEPTISRDERPQTYAFDRAATGIGPSNDYWPVFPCGKLAGKSS
jgi:hypothetical protein